MHTDTHTIPLYSPPAMVAACMEATASIFSDFNSPLPSFTLSKFPITLKPLSPSPFLIHLGISIPTLPLPLKSPFYSIKRPSFEIFSSVEEVAVLEKPNESEDGNQKRKLHVVNLPWSSSVDDLKKAFSDCGTVKEVELIKNKDGKHRGYAFITMASGVEAQAVIDKFHLKELSGRTIRVEYARRLKKPRPQPAAVAPVEETRHKLYVSNLQWKARSSHLREFFSASFNPVSARVVFENASGRSAGYGFVSFSTREEAEAAISSLDGKELLGRPVRLKFSERNTEGTGSNEEDKKENANESGSGLGDEDVEGQAEES